MIDNLEGYFCSEQEYYLEEIEYKRLDELKQAVKEDNYLNVEDAILVERINDEGLKITVSRKLFFDPEELFRGNVVYGAYLRFIPEKFKEVNWDEEDLVEQFRIQGRFVIDNLMTRISLMYAQITSSYGNQPVILPPTIMKKE